ncbi:MAG: SusF/SusE family outer membrane protein [Bacteroidales bacterium]|jgi:hypothetical protein|nr:SusF/SusE family outer membrane protein [Bacteroidales bacterium]
MKKLSILILAIGLFSLFSCKKDETKVVLTYFTPAQVLTPSTGSSYILKKVNKDSLLFTYTWSNAKYNLTDVIKPTYTVEMDTAGGTFSKPTVITTTKDLSFSMTVGAMNKIILSIFMGEGDSLATFQFRVRASLADNNPATNNASEVITLNITPYSDIVIVSPIYILGDATEALWDNTKALEMTHIGDAGQFAIVAHLLANKQIKFIGDLGQWTPMWGLGEIGTPDSGLLKYRPIGDPNDPPIIPSPAIEGDYRVMADTANLKYEVTLTSAQLFLVGNATTAGWTPANGIPFTKVSPGIFTITTTLTAGGMKFLETTTGWAPQWGTDLTGTGNFGPLIYRPTESVTDPPEIPSPGAGTFTISVNLATKEYKIAAK